MSTTFEWLALAGAIGTGAMGGVFLAFSTFVMQGVGRLPYDQGIAAMQSINVAAVRPAFMSVLFAPATLCVVLVVRALLTWGDDMAAWLLAGGTAYLLGAIGLTITYHVPRNSALASLRPGDGGSEGEWRRYVAQWTAANHVRAAASLAASVTLILACAAG